MNIDAILEKCLEGIPLDPKEKKKLESFLEWIKKGYNFLYQC